jgi:hypothetical protein
VNYLFTCDGVFVGILCEVIFSGNNTQRKWHGKNYTRVHSGNNGSAPGDISQAQDDIDAIVENCRVCFRHWSSQSCHVQCIAYCKWGPTPRPLLLLWAHFVIQYIILINEQ